MTGHLPRDDQLLGEQPGRVRAVPLVPLGAAEIAYTTNSIESLNARFRRAVRHRHFPNEQAAMKVLHLVATTRRENRQDLIGRTAGWKPILNALTIR